MVLAITGREHSTGMLKGIEIMVINCAFSYFKDHAGASKSVIGKALYVQVVRLREFPAGMF